MAAAVPPEAKSMKKFLKSDLSGMIKEYGRISDLSYELEWYQYFRDIPATHYRRNSVCNGDDETLLTRRKYNRGRVVHNYQWLFRGIEVGSRRAFLKLVRRRGVQTLERIIRRHILPGITIVSDSWRAYNNLTSLPMFYWHLFVNHRLNFVNPTTGAHTQNIES
ncbi:unnamed protein product [Nippostrongylus brasiliensis]|uniref:DDE_Tnp_IS1595 domain-containing protein n=1 Tax=Nippostrongylus brasiliensis TaxID=27835 RepID=A0A0N4YPN1_NIPBR|nr:unnamed protein product [Nippostrongylus brasiliensis]